MNLDLLMRNRYSKDFIKWLKGYAPDHTMEEIINKTGISKDRMRKLLWRLNVKHKDYNKNLAHGHVSNTVPIGSETVKPDGMILLKVGKNKWMYKQRYIYEQYHNVKLSSKQMVIFLDGDRSNFDIDNLRVVDKSTFNVLANKHLYLKGYKDYTEAAISLAELHLEIK